MALALRLEQLLRSGVVVNYAELARLGRRERKLRRASPSRGQLRCFLILPVVQLVFEIGTGLLCFLFVGCLGRTALGSSGIWVDPLQHQGGAILEMANPDSHSFVRHAESPRIAT